MPSPLDTHAFAEVALRRFARATNLSIAGRVFAIDAIAGANVYLDEVGRVLAALGARVVWSDASAMWRSQYPSVSATFGAANGAPVVTVETTTIGGCSDPRVTVSELTDERPTIDDVRVATASAKMPVMHALLPKLAEVGRGSVIGSTLALEPKTVALLIGLHEAGIEVHAFGWPDEVHLPMLNVLHEHAIATFVASETQTGPRGAFGDELERAQRDFLASGIEYLIDDGGHLLVRATESSEASSLRGGSEETTSGIRLLAQHALPIPVLSANDAPMKTMFDNAFGTGQSCAFTMLDVLAADGSAWPVHGKRIVIAGYGPVGEGTARHLAALGASVTIVEPDVQRALLATYHGYRVTPLVDAVRDADLVVSATGIRHTITLAALLAMPAGCAVGVAGGVEDEIALDDLAASGAREREAAQPGVASGGSMQNWQRTLGDAEMVDADMVDADMGDADMGDAGIVILDHGLCINLSAGEGNPIDIMDYSFAVQLQALRHLLTHDELPPGLQALSAAANTEVAALALAVAQSAPFTIEQTLPGEIE